MVNEEGGFWDSETRASKRGLIASGLFNGPRGTNKTASDE
jgi:hypothetical protein